MLEGKKRRSKSGDNFAEMAADTTRKSAISVIEVSSSISLSDSMTEATTVAQKSSSDGTIIGKRSISFGAPRNRLAKARTPSSGARSGKGSSQVSVLTVSISDSEDVDARGPPPPRRGRNSLASRSRPESPPWTSARTPQHVTRSCSRHLAMQKAAQMRGYSRSPSPKPGYTVASSRMYSASPTRVRSPMRVQSPRRTVFQVVDESYYAEPVVRDRARLLRREDQRFQMTADDPKPQRDGKWHEPKLRVSYAARVPSRGSHSDSSLSYSMSSKTALDYERGDSSRGYYRTASQLDRYRDPSGAKSYSSTPQLHYEDSPPRTYHDHSPVGGYVEGSRHASGAPIHGRDVSLSRISEYSSPNAGNQDSTGKMLVSVSSSRLVRSASLPRESSFNPRMPRRGTPRNARSSSSPRQSRSMSPRKPDTAPARIKVRAASSLHLGYETSSSRSASSRRVTPNWLERNGLFPDGPLSPPPPKPPVPPPMPPPKGFSMGPLGFESTSTSASAIRITMSPPPMPPVPPMLPPPTPTEIAALQAVTIKMKDLGRKQSSSEHELGAAELQHRIREKQQVQLEQLFQLQQQTQDFTPLQAVEEQQLQQQLQELQKVLQQQEGAPVLQVQFQSPADPSGKPSTPLAQSVLQVQFQRPSQPVPQVFQAQIPTRADSPPGVIQIQLQSPIVPSEPQQADSFSKVTSPVAHTEQPGVLQVQLGSPLDFQTQPVSTQQCMQADQISVLQAQLQSAIDFSALTGPSQVDQLSVHQSPLEPKSTTSDQAGLLQMQLQGLMDFPQQPDQLGAMQAQLQSQLGFPVQATAQAQQPEPPGVIQMQFHSPSTASTGFIGQETAQTSLLDQSFLQSPTPQMNFTDQLMSQIHMAGSSMPQMGSPYQTMSQIQLSMHQEGQLDEPMLPQQGGFASPQISHGQQPNQSFLQMQMQSPMMPSVDFASQPFQQPPISSEQMSQEQELAQNMLLEQQNRQLSLQMHLGTSSLSNFMQGSGQAMQESMHQMPSQQPAMQDMQDWVREQIQGEPMCLMQEWRSAMPGQALQMSEGMVSPDKRDARLQAIDQNQLFNQIIPQELSFNHMLSQGLPQSPSMQIMNEMMQTDQLTSRSSPQMQLAERRMEEMRLRDPLQQQLLRQRSQPHTVVMFQTSDQDIRHPRPQGMPRPPGMPRPRSSEPRMQRTRLLDLDEMAKQPHRWWFSSRMPPRTPSSAESYSGMVFASPPRRSPVPFMMRTSSPILPRGIRMPSPYPRHFHHNLPQDVTPGTPSQLRTPKPQEEKPQMPQQMQKPHTPQPQCTPQPSPTPQQLPQQAPTPQKPSQSPQLLQSSQPPQAPQPAQTPQRKQSSQEQQQPKQVTQKLQQTSQNSEPCKQKIPLPVTGYEPRMHEPPFSRFPFDMPRPRSAAPLTTPSPRWEGPLRISTISPRPSFPSQPFCPRSPAPEFPDLRQLELQTRMQQQMLEQQQQQMRQQMMAVARLQCPPRPTRSPTSPIPMMPRSSPNLLPPYGAPMLLQQQMQKMQQGNQMNRLRGMASDTDGAGYMRRKMLSGTKSSMPDMVSPSDYGNTTLGTKSLAATLNMIDKRKPLPPHIHAHTHVHRKQNYRHSAIETRMRNSQTEMVVYFVVLLATIIGLWTVLDIYGRRTAVHSLNGSYIAIPNASMKGLRDSSDQNGVPLNVSGQPGFELCSSSACLAEGSYVSNQLNWNVNPCESMYEFVCSNSPTKPADELLLSDMETSLLHKLRGAPSDESPATKLMHDLWKECLDQDTRNRLGWGPLKHMFKATSLPDWPYQQFTTQGEPAVWQAAARALRYFGLATLVLLEPSEHPLLGRSPLLALDKPVLLLHPANDSSWYYDAVSLALSAAARKNVAKHSIALDLTNFARQLASVVRSPGASGDLGRDAKLERLRSVPRYRALLAGFLQNDSLVNDDTELLLRAPEYAIRLGYLLDDTAPHVALNYIGFRLLVHVSPFVPESLRKLVPLRARQLGLGDHGPGQLVCLRAVEDAMPNVFYRAAYELHRPLMDAVLAADFGGALKQVLASRLALLHWLDGDTRERALQRLHQIEPRLLFPTSVTDAAKAEQDVRQTPHVIVGEGLRSYARITKHLMHRRLQSADPWLGQPPSDDQCWMGPGHRTLYLPLTALNASAPAQEPFVLLQLARLGERAAHCLVRLVLEGAGSRAEDPRAWWTPAARQGLAEMRKCYALQSRGDRPTAAEESAALVVAHAAFEARMPSLEFRLENAVSMSLDQLFFIHYTLGYCTADSDVARRVNLALLNFGGFQRAFTCDAGTPMNPRKSCDFW